MNLSSPLVEYANLKKECSIIGVNDRLEIWSSERFNKQMEENDEQVSDIAENLFEVDFEF